MFGQLIQSVGVLNFGIGGDRTQHVLWRIENGELDFGPHIVVVCIGTNNIYAQTEDQIAEGIEAVVTAIRHRLPAAHVDINEKMRQRLMPKRDPMLTFVGETFTRDLVNPVDGKISALDMYDFLHFSEQGYRKFCRPIVDEIHRLFGPIVG
jgi:platelet-activating factor acetylhydrolase IB subunit beta/gamma